MGVPIEKRLGNVQKTLLTGILDGGKSFDPNNPKDVKRRKELEKQVEALQSISSLVTDPTGGGLVGMAKGISKAAFAKMAKSKFTQNKAKQIADLVTKPMTRGKKAVTKTTKKVTPAIPTTIPTSGSTASDKIKSLSNAEIKAFENVKNARELAEKQAKNAPTTTTPKSIRDSWEYNNTGRDYYIDGVEGFRKAGTEAKSIVSRLKDREAAKNAAKKAFEENNPEIIKKSNAQTAMSIAALTSVIGGGAGATYYGMQLSNKDKKQTTTPQKTGPVDLKRINPSKLKPSSIPGVSITTAIVNGKEKEFGIVWDNKTQSWDYYRGNKTTETPKPDLKREDVGGGYTPIKDNKGSGSGGKTTTGGGTGTKPRSATGQAFDKAFAEARKQAGGAAGIFEWNGKKYGTALKGETVPKDRVEVGKTIAPIMGDEEYKKDPRLATLRQQDDDRQLLARAEAQKKEMETKTTKPLSSLVFKTQTESKGNTTKELISMYDEERAMDAENRYNAAKNNMPKKKYGGNLAMLKYMKQ